MAADKQASYLYRFLDDVLDLLPKDDRDLFATLWSGIVQASADILGLALETDLATDSFEMVTFESERWDRYVMDPSTADMNIAEEVVPAAGTTSLAVRGVFHSTIEVTGSDGNPRTDTITFGGDETLQLFSGRIVKNTVAVTDVTDTITFHEGFDYAINYRVGTIQRAPNTGIPPGQTLKVRYKREVLKLGVEYTVAPIPNTVTIITGGAPFTISYVRDNTPGPLLVGRNAQILLDLQTLQDDTQDFTGLLPGRTLVVLNAPNAGTYTVASVPSSNRVKITGFFPVSIAGVNYTIDAFPYGMSVDKRIISIPILQDRIHSPGVMLIEGVDYLVRDGMLGFRQEPPFNSLGPRENRLPIFWAEITRLDEETPFRNFGVLIDFYRKNADTYVNALRGLLYAFWTGSSHGNLIRGIHILLGLPFSTRPGTVIAINEFVLGIDRAVGDNVVNGGVWTIGNGAFTSPDFGRRLRVKGSGFNDGDHVISAINSTTSVTTDDQGTVVTETFPLGTTFEVRGDPVEIVIRTDRNHDVTFLVPRGLVPAVAVGDSIDRFQALTNGVEIFDKINEPGFITTRLGPAGIAKWFATLPMTPADIAKALVNLEEHVFIPSVLTDAVSETTSLKEILNFLTQLKPEWTDFVFRFSVEVTEPMTIEEDLKPGDIGVLLDLTTKVVQNEQNLAQAGQLLDSFTGRIEFDGFGVRVLRDVVSLVAYNSGDAVEILSGPSAGTYSVLVRTGPSELRLFPEPPALDPSVHWRIFSSVLALAHDAVNIQDEVLVNGVGVVV